MFNPYRTIYCLSIAFALPGCASTLPARSVEAVANGIAAIGEQQMQLSPEQLRALQSRDYDVARDTAFAAAMTTFLDLGYRIQQADVASGLIVASASSAERLRLDFSGLGTSRQTPVASAIVEARGSSRSRVRINLAMSTASGAAGAQGERAILEEAPYRTYFQQLAIEIADRKAATTTEATASAPTSAD